MQKLIKSPLFYINIVLLIAFFLLITSINVNQTNLPSFLKKAIAAVQAITGEGGVGYLSAFTATNQIGNSIIYDYGTSIRIDTQDTTNEGGEIELDGAGTYGSVNIDNYQGHARIFGLASGKQFQVLGGGAYIEGNVGIGTNTPGQKLEVNGVIKTLSSNISIGERYAAPAPAVISDGTNMGIKTNGSFYVLDSTTNAFKNVQANDYWINATGKWASQMGGGCHIDVNQCGLVNHMYDYDNYHTTSCDYANNYVQVGIHGKPNNTDREVTAINCCKMVCP